MRTLPAPHRPDDVDGLGERVDGFLPVSPQAAHCRDRVLKGPSAEPELDPPTESASRLAADLARTAGGHNGSDDTVGTTVIRSVRATR
ncbi:hypothetical protein GCM10023175_60780 [Pseudonocardia xishanensis]|uniref:Uncharacterized protein n=1 Tax=Pseudonocardia xishanensis TaxID=630995 RepID=A0ABP8S1Y6_9PSEU